MEGAVIFQYLLYLLGYSIGPFLVLSWFLIKVKPKFPSGLSMTIVVFFSILTVFTIDSILGFAMTPLTHHKTISLTYYSKVSILEETTKIVVALLGILIAKEDSSWTDTKLTLAFLSGLTFGVSECAIYLANFKFTTWGTLTLFFTRLIHPVMTITLMAGLLLIVNDRKLPGVIITPLPYVTHALLDYSIVMKEYFLASVVIIVTLLAFVVGIYLLLPIIREEQRTRTRFKEEATLNIEEHWLKKLG